MNTYRRHRFRPDIISYAVWLYYRFNLSHRRCAGPFIEDILAERGITVSRGVSSLGWFDVAGVGNAFGARQSLSRQSIRLWCIKFGAIYTRRLKRRHQGYGDTFFIGEVFVKINGKRRYLWRAVDEESLPREALWVWRGGRCVSSGP